MNGLKCQAGIYSFRKLIPLGAALLPYIALGGTVYFGGRILVWLYQWVVDQIQGGPVKRQFQAIGQKIADCISLLVSIDDPDFSQQIHTPLEYQEKRTRLRVRLEYLQEGLSNLGINMPNVDLNSQPARSNLLIYLTTLEVRAQYGDIQSARNFDKQTKS